MMRLSNTIAVLVLALCAPLSAASARTHLPVVPHQAQAPADCQASLNELTSKPDWLAQVFGPVLSSKPEIDSTLDLYSRVHICLSEESGVFFPEADVIDKLVEYFLIFAGGLGTDEHGSSLELVSLRTSTDPAVQELRDSFSIPAPPGFIYVRSYDSLDAMPALVRAGFMNPGVQGFTQFNRYIAVLRDPNKPSSLASPILSHELVHAYINSASGPGPANFPTWFAEGLAVHFSHSSEPSCVLYALPSHELMGECQMAPQDYEQYAENFLFLQDALGSAKFRTLVRQSVLNRDPSLLYRDLTITSYSDLVQRADQWRITHNESDASRILVIGVGGVGVLCLIALMAVGAKWLLRALSTWRFERAANEPEASPAVKLAVQRKWIIPVARPSPGVSRAPLIQAQPSAPQERPIRSMSSEEMASIEALWTELLSFPEPLGSAERVQAVERIRGLNRDPNWLFDHACPNCGRRSVFPLPADVSYEKYAEGLERWGKTRYAPAQPPAVILRPYAVCLFCGTRFGADRHDIPRPPLPLPCRR